MSWISSYTKCDVEYILMLFCNAVEGADLVVLPAVFAEVAQEFQISPKSLGTLTMARGILQALTSPLAGVLDTRFDRRLVIGFGALLWALATFALAGSVNYAMLFAFRAINGIGLGIAPPLIYAFVADSHPKHNHGKAFGFLGLVAGIGVGVGGIVSTSVAATSLGPISGWRIALSIIATLSLLLGVGVLLAVRFERNGRGGGRGREFIGGVVPEGGVTEAMKLVLRIRSFQVIIGQGVLGSAVWAAFAFITWWLRLSCFESWEAGFLLAIVSLSNSIGTLIGGWIGDYFARLSPNHGRALAAQISVASGIPMIYVLLFLLPTGEKRSLPLFATLFFIFGTVISWCGTGVNNPILSEIVPISHRSMCFGLDRTFEGAVGAIGPAIVGVLATDVFGWNDKGDHFCDEENAKALGNAIFATSSICWLGCFAVYSLLHITYPKDRLVYSQDEDEDIKSDKRGWERIHESSRDNENRSEYVGDLLTSHYELGDIEPHTIELSNLENDPTRVPRTSDVRSGPSGAGQVSKEESTRASDSLSVAGHVSKEESTRASGSLSGAGHMSGNGGEEKAFMDSKAPISDNRKQASRRASGASIVV
ncbi:hypothetical protein AAMO2058_000533200 [Amorphochlora amoebiformis]